MYSHVAGIKNSPARERECHTCKRKGHLARSQKCTQRRVATIDEEDDHCEDAGLYVRTVTQVDSIAKSADWTETIQIGSQSVTFKLDTGAQANLLPADVFVSVESNSVYNKLECTNLQLKAYSSHTVPMLGHISLLVMVAECRHEVTFVVVKQGDPVLGKDAWRRMLSGCGNHAITERSSS